MAVVVVVVVARERGGRGGKDSVRVKARYAAGWLVAVMVRTPKAAGPGGGAERDA